MKTNTEDGSQHQEDRKIDECEVDMARVGRVRRMEWRMWRWRWRRGVIHGLLLLQQIFVILGLYDFQDFILSYEVLNRIFPVVSRILNNLWTTL